MAAITPNQNPEQKARDRIDQQLISSPAYTKSARPATNNNLGNGRRPSRRGKRVGKMGKGRQNLANRDLYRAYQMMFGPASALLERIRTAKTAQTKGAAKADGPRKKYKAKAR